MSDRDRRHEREIEAREDDAAQEVRVGTEPPKEPEPSEVRPGATQRIAWAVGGAVLVAALLWLASRLIDAERLFYLAPAVAAGVAAAVLGGAIRDPRGRLGLAALTAVGILVTAVLFGAPILGTIIAAVVFLPALNRATGFGSVVSGALRPIRQSYHTSVREPVARWVQPRRRLVLPIIGLVIIALFASLPYLGEWFEIPDWLAAATSGGTLSRLALFSLFALGLNVVVGFAGLLDLGYVAFWAIGSYTAAIMTGAARYTMALREGQDVPEPMWQPWMWLILVAALGVALVAGILLGSPTLRLRGDYLAIVTLGFGEIIRIAANNFDQITVGPRGITSIPHPRITLPGQGLENDIVWGTLIDEKYYYLLLVLVVLWIIAIRFLDHSRIGRAWVAIREDEVAAASMGVPVVRMKLAAFVIGASTAGVGGVVYAEQANFINPGTFDILNSILILCCVVIGGMGSIAGSVLGAAAIIVLPEIFREFSEYRIFAFGVALVVVMIFRPQGLLPSKRRTAELKGEVVEEQLYEAGAATAGRG
jgi:branched-chain amino acid transport system permease protein